MLHGSLEATSLRDWSKLQATAARRKRAIWCSRDEKKPWSEKIFRRTEPNVEIWGM